MIRKNFAKSAETDTNQFWKILEKSRKIFEGKLKRETNNVGDFPKIAAKFLRKKFKIGIEGLNEVFE